MFGSLDFLYTPSSDVAADMEHLVELGGEVVFAIDGMGARVAAVRLHPGPPLVLLTDHLEGERPILVFRVADVEATQARLAALGWTRGSRREIPHGPCWSFTTPGGHRLALYELARPEVAAHFEGRRDF
jgi:hypothetical protein